MRTKIFKAVKWFILFNMLGWTMKGALDNVSAIHGVQTGKVDKKDITVEYVWVSVIKKLIRMIKEW
jgi:hypothetical protein